MLVQILVEIQCKTPSILSTFYLFRYVDEHRLVKQAISEAHMLVTPVVLATYIRRCSRDKGPEFEAPYPGDVCGTPRRDNWL